MYLFVCYLHEFASSRQAGVTATATGTNYFGPVTVPPLMKDRPPHLIHPLYSLRAVRGFFNVPQNLYVQGLWDGARGLSSLAEKTRKSSRLQMYLQRPPRGLSRIYPSPEWEKAMKSSEGSGSMPPPENVLKWICAEMQSGAFWDTILRNITVCARTLSCLDDFSNIVTNIL